MTSSIITHIYFGTAGAAGLYTKAIKKAINDDVNNNFIVNYYYPDDDAQRLFFQHTELSGPNRLRRLKYLRFFVRYAELVLGLLKSYVHLKKTRTGILNYSLISQHVTELFFLFICKKILNLNIILTLHDVAPFKRSYISIINQLTVKQKILELADGIIVHNNSSVDVLRSLFKCDARIYYHPFPLMDPNISHTFMERSIIQPRENKIFSFLFVGHPREEKGIDILCSAWEIFSNSKKNVELIIASNIDKNSELLNRVRPLAGVKIIRKFIPDADYFDLIKNADCVILPYRLGTNSGIPGTVASLNTAIITSNIPMFYENDLVPRHSMFESGSPSSLALKMQQIFTDGVDNFSITSSAISIYETEFKSIILSVYRDMTSRFNCA